MLLYCVLIKQFKKLFNINKMNNKMNNFDEQDIDCKLFLTTNAYLQFDYC